MKVKLKKFNKYNGLCSQIYIVIIIFIISILLILKIDIKIWLAPFCSISGVIGIGLINIDINIYNRKIDIKKQENKEKIFLLEKFNLIKIKFYDSINEYNLLPFFVYINSDSKIFIEESDEHKQFIKIYSSYIFNIYNFSKTYNYNLWCNYSKHIISFKINDDQNNIIKEHIFFIQMVYIILKYKGKKDGVDTANFIADINIEDKKIIFYSCYNCADIKNFTNF